MQEVDIIDPTLGNWVAALAADRTAALRAMIDADVPVVAADGNAGSMFTDNSSMTGLLLARELRILGCTKIYVGMKPQVVWDDDRDDLDPDFDTEWIARVSPDEYREMEKVWNLAGYTLGAQSNTRPSWVAKCEYHPNDNLRPRPYGSRTGTSAIIRRYVIDLRREDYIEYYVTRAQWLVNLFGAQGLFVGGKGHFYVHPQTDGGVLTPTSVTSGQNPMLSTFYAADEYEAAFEALIIALNRAGVTTLLRDEGTGGGGLDYAWLTATTEANAAGYVGSFVDPP
jgi:hypothetical protein